MIFEMDLNYWMKIDDIELEKTRNFFRDQDVSRNLKLSNLTEMLISVNTLNCKEISAFADKFQLIFDPSNARDTKIIIQMTLKHQSQLKKLWNSPGVVNSIRYSYWVFRCVCLWCGMRFHKKRKMLVSDVQLSLIVSKCLHEVLWEPLCAGFVPHTHRWSITTTKDAVHILSKTTCRKYSLFSAANTTNTILSKNSGLRRAAWDIDVRGTCNCHAVIAFPETS